MGVTIIGTTSAVRRMRMYGRSMLRSSAMARPSAIWAATVAAV